MRNITAGVFSAISDPVYQEVTPPVATSILGGIAGLFGLAPFVLYLWGDRLRAKSKVTCQLARQEDEKQEAAAAAGGVGTKRCP